MGIELKNIIDAATGERLCPYCHELKTKLVRLHSFKQGEYITHAYQCSSCGRIVWGKENLEEDANAED